MTPQQIDLFDKLLRIKEAGMITPEEFEEDRKAIRQLHLPQYGENVITAKDNALPLGPIYQSVALSMTNLSVLTRLEALMLGVSEELVRKENLSILTDKRQQTYDQYVAPNEEDLKKIWENSKQTSEYLACSGALDFLRDKELIGTDEYLTINKKLREKFSGN